MRRLDSVCRVIQVPSQGPAALGIGGDYILEYTIKYTLVVIVVYSILLYTIIRRQSAVIWAEKNNVNLTVEFKVYFPAESVNQQLVTLKQFLKLLTSC